MLKYRKEQNAPVKEAQNNNSPQEPEDEKLYTIHGSLRERIDDIIHSVIGSGYDLVTKPHTATWLVLFMIVVIYYTCFYAEYCTILFEY